MVAVSTNAPPGGMTTGAGLVQLKPGAAAAHGHAGLSSKLEPSGGTSLMVTKLLNGVGPSFETRT